MNHIKLGQLIRKIEGNKNKELKDLPLLGINIDKEFMPSVANTIGTDMSNYQIVKKYQFACNPMHLGRDERMPTAILLKEDEILVSPAYFVFEIIDENIILPEYLMLYFKRSETDRFLWFKTDSSVRGGLAWDQMCEIEIPVPSIETQHKIVTQYNQISNAISVKERLNNNLEQQIEIIFNNLFKDDFDFITLSDVIFTTSGGTPSRNINEYYQNGHIDWIKSKELTGNFILDTEEKITQEAVKKSSAKLLPPYAVLIAMYGANVGEYGITTKETTCNQAVCALLPNENYPYTYIYAYIRASKDSIKSLAVGSAQQNISQLLIKQLQIHSNTDKIKLYNKKTTGIFSSIELNQREIYLLLNLRDTLLPKLMSSELSDKLSFN